MQHFTSRKDVTDIQALLKKAQSISADPFQQTEFGKNKTLGLIFFNSSLRTRLSTQKAAANLGMNCIVMNIGTDGWKLEFQDGIVMDQDKAEHAKDAIAVMGSYCDILGVRAFPGLKDRQLDYEEQILNSFIQYAGVPIVSLESSTLHPLQSFADLISIESYKKTEKPKVVLTWAPHPRALPQAVGNSFVEWMKETDYELVITHPKGYELAEKFCEGVSVEYDQRKAFEGADFIYAKNWSSYSSYGEILSQDNSWIVNGEKMALTNDAHFMHCLPVRRNVVVADEVIDSPKSLVIQQAANRVVSVQTVLATLLENLEK